MDSSKKKELDQPYGGNKFPKARLDLVNTILSQDRKKKTASYRHSSVDVLQSSLTTKFKVQSSLTTTSNIKSLNTCLNRNVQIIETRIKSDTTKTCGLSLKSSVLPLTSSKSSNPYLTKPTSNLHSVNLTSSLLGPSVPQPSLLTHSSAVPNKRPSHLVSSHETKKSRVAPGKKTEPTHETLHDGSPRSVFKAPTYSLSRDAVVREHLPFSLSDQDPTLVPRESLADQILAEKLALVNSVSGSLICAPKYRDVKDEARSHLITQVLAVAQYDPEFILKLALYTRKELNIRSTSNFLLAVASSSHACRPYIKKYFSKAVCLPSDWIDVAELYQFMGDDSINLGALPSVLRRAMISKFPEFDEYQLAKYNKEKSRLKKRKASQITKETKADDPGDTSVDEDGDTAEEVRKRSFTLKQLVRKLHIMEPAHSVMCLVGRKYPDNFEAFIGSRLSGEWDSERGGKRMRLAVPETWETQVSLKGNKADTWEQLLDNRKLPFMAMLRNLRNMIEAGISAKHHKTVLGRLCDEKSVINSKQFPFRFFSAYEVLTTLEKKYQEQERVTEESWSSACEVVPPRPRVRRGANKVPWWINKKKKQAATELLYSPALLQKYRDALDKAVRISTAHNIPPIKGRTVVICHVCDALQKLCKLGGGLGSKRTHNEVILLLGLMCKYACEDCDLILYNSHTRLVVQLAAGTILHNMDSLLTQMLDVTTDPKQSWLPTGFPLEHLLGCLDNRHQIDNVIVALDSFDPQGNDARHLKRFLREYRALVNPQLLFVAVTLAGSHLAFEPQPDSHPNDVHLCGFSDQLLRFVAERGSGQQLTRIEKIDEAYELPSLDWKSTRPRGLVERPKSTVALMTREPVWRNVRVFISSTFKDMHGERDLLARFVFPELRARAASLCVNVYEIDLRWGVTEEHSRQSKGVEQCLHELSKTDYFVGILGERYGWVPGQKNLPSDLANWPIYCKRSMTDLEFTMCREQYTKRYGHPQSLSHMFVFMRDPSFIKDVPKAYTRDFCAEDRESSAALSKLKNSELRSSNIEIYDGYPCTWGGVVDGCPMVAGLQPFADRVLACLWAAIERDHPVTQEHQAGHERVKSLHQAAFLAALDSFVGRAPLFRRCLAKLAEIDSGLLAVVGKPGIGKTTLAAAMLDEYYTRRHSNLTPMHYIIHMVGATPGSASITPTIKRFLLELNDTFNLGIEIPEEHKNLLVNFWRALREAGNLAHHPIVFFIDGVDSFTSHHQPHDLHWVPDELPQGVIFMMTVSEDGACHQALRRRGAHELSIPPLEILDKPVLIRHTLDQYGKQLDDAAFNQQMRILLGKREANIPLYLRLACDEIRVFGQFEQLGQKMRCLPSTIPTLLQEILSRMETDHTRDLVSAALSFLHYSRIGLSEGDLMQLLLLYQSNRDSDPTSLFSITKTTTPIPYSTFRYLYRALESFLRPATNELERLSIEYSATRAAIVQRYIKPINKPCLYHTLLAGYYHSAADVDQDFTWGGQSIEAFTELPYHLMCASLFVDLTSVICDLTFIKAKASLGCTSELLADYEPADGLSRMQLRDHTKFMTSQRVVQYHQFVQQNLHIITKYPALVVQQALNSPADTCVHQDACALNLDSNQKDGPRIISWTNKPTHLDPCIFSISDLPKVVLSVSVSGDGTQFVCGDQDGNVTLYQLTTAKEVRSFHGHSDAITSVCFAGSNRVVTAAADTVCLWDSQSGHRVALLKSHQRRVNRVISHGKLIASVAWDGRTLLWNAENGELFATLTDDAARPLNCAAFHPEGHQIVTGGWDETLRIWHIASRERKAIFRGHKSSVRDVTFSPSGRHVVSASLDGDVKLWWAATGQQVGSVRGHSGPINSLTYTPDGQQLITASNDHKIKVWAGLLGKQIQCFGTKRDNGVATAIAFSHDGSLVAVGYHEGDIRLYDVNTGDTKYEGVVHAARIRSLRFVPHKQLVVSGGDDGCTYVTNTDSGGSASKNTPDIVYHQKSHSLLPQTRPILCLTVTTEYIVTGSEDCVCRVYTKLSNAYYSQVGPLCELLGHTGPVTGCTFNSHCTQLATSSRDMSVLIWDTDSFTSRSQTPTPVMTLRDCHADWITDCRWSDISDTIVTASNDFNLKVWDVATGDEKAKMTGHMASINCLAFMYGCVVSACTDGSVKVWSHRGTEVTTLHGHTDRVNSCDIHITQIGSERRERPKLSDCKVLVATCSDDGTVRIWKPLQADEKQCLTGHSDRVLSVSASPTAARATTPATNILSTSLDKTVKVWSCMSDGEASPPLSHDAPVTCLMSSLHAKIFVSGSRDGLVKLWRIDGKEHTLLDSREVDGSPVTAMCFLDNKGRKFIVGTNNGTVYLYNIIGNVTISPIIRSFRQSVGRGSSVTNLVWNHHATKQCTFLITTTSSLDVIEWDFIKGCTTYLYVMKPAFLEPPFDGRYDYCTKLVVSQTQPIMYLMTSIGYVYTFNLIDKALRVLHHVGTRMTDGYITSTSPHSLVMSDADGSCRVIDLDSNFITTRKVHIGATSCVAGVGDVIMTGSDDRSIKLWNDATFSQQVGLMPCPAPVTCIAPHPFDNGVIYGDQFGNINSLQWF